jgi:hypothetical protein
MSNRAIFASILLTTTVSLAGLTIWQSSSVLAAERVNITDRDTKTQELNPEKDPQTIGDLRTKPIGVLRTNALYELSGSLGNQYPGSSLSVDRTDHYQFRIVKAGRYVMSLGGAIPPGGAELRLYNSTTLIGNRKPGQPIDLQLQPGTYRLEVFRTPFASGSFNYGVAVITPQS